MLHAHIIGLGRSGSAAARLLQQNGWTVVLSDRGNSETLRQQQQQLERDGITVQLGQSPSLDTSPPQLIVASPGVPWDLPLLVEARTRGIETIGEMELAWRHLNASPWVGITGTNGKTTTTALTAAIFQAANLDAPACGNIGYAACELALQKDSPYDWIIAELSSYQIESSSQLAPQIGIWTTFTPDHLSRHYTLENYYKIKASLLNRSQAQIFNGDDPYLRDVGLKEWSNAVWTSVRGKEGLLCKRDRGVYLDEDGWVVAFEERILSASSLKMVGDHNQQNLLMAVAAARLAGIEKRAIAQAVATFPGVPHRLEYICTHAGADFINDSKATNYDAAQVGLASVATPTLLIAGGELKEGDDTAWIETIKAKAVKVLLIGDAATPFSERLQQSGYNSFEIVKTMENAVSRASELAQNAKISVVLLSPACASFDQYKSFEHRGEHFRELCLQLNS
ncbi:UDP-N-acetylmuramoyl-L-alanine--D-glutamate ligase [Lusitaniella coriacea LEGE 07157]|uniref:UDP-N-acetylmuramoylalanine--D-glutamate ligase n=1 Tax=Lusitaniella coriacea LEGE 07157 TaxID=945747 RepID=A0A8J7DW77_9CYAN|nr:UDP-N-acetylmuramoyl-L-alanine--D-glutamate ligase [Lusitaniella coriacea]MBE9116304.1 UDP-N-acetylmuramoyl-L-alanine--D-glutamate ligase [Lusitaniella coriacea LEGE 07157]